MILESNLVDLLNRRLFKLVSPDINLCDVLVALQRVLQSCRVAISDLIAADVQMSNRLVALQKLSERLAEHIAQLIRAQAQEVQTRIVVQQIDAQLGAGLVIKSVQL